MDLKYEELKKEFAEFRKWIVENNSNVDEEAVLNYYLSATLAIWGRNVLYSPNYTTLLNALSDGDYTIEQTITAMGCCGDADRMLAVPVFFNSMVERDLRDGTNNCSVFIEKLNHLVVASAAINGDFTIEEADYISALLSDLCAFAAAKGLRIINRPDNSSRVTGKKTDSYLQKDNITKLSRKNESLEVKEKEKEPTPINITINSINLSGSPAGNAGQFSSEKVSDAEKPDIKQPYSDEGETMESLLGELDGLVGLENVKRDVHSLINFIKVTKIRESRGMTVPTISYHLVFTGNPGTGKTTVARLVAKLYYHMGILPQGQLVETDRSALVAGYLGQTAIKTQKVIQQAMGGVLFIDEAYSLAGDDQDSYGKEAIETILKAMEDHRDELVVIVAGYTDLMHKFIESNPGLSSRFSKYFEYPDYTGEELIAIFERFCKKNGYKLEDGAGDLLREKFEMMYENRDKHFGNARTARNIFEKAINAQANRIASRESLSDVDLENITADDISTALGGGQ